MGRPAVHLAAALVTVVAITVLLPLPSCANASFHNRRPRRLGAPSYAPSDAPWGGPVSTIEGVDGFRRYLSAIARSPENAPWSSPGAPVLPPMTSGAPSSDSPSKSRIALIAGLSALAGLVLGAILVGVLLFWCIQRRNSQPGTNDQDKRPVPGGDTSSLDKRPVPGGDTSSLDKRPQEARRDKRAIRDTI